MNTLMQTFRQTTDRCAAKYGVVTAVEYSPFQSELLAEFRRIMRECKADGASELGFDCLFMHLRFRNIPNAPQGPNAVSFIKQEMRRLLASRQFDYLVDRSTL